MCKKQIDTRGNAFYFFENRNARKGSKMGDGTTVLKQGWSVTRGQGLLFLSKVILFGCDEKHYLQIPKVRFLKPRH